MKYFKTLLFSLALLTIPYTAFAISKPLAKDTVVTDNTLGDNVQTALDTVEADLPSQGAAPKDAKYIVQQADSVLTNEQAMGALTTGLVKNTTSTGVQSIAVAGTDYVATEVDPVVKAQVGLIKSNGSTISSTTDNSANWDTAYTNRILSATGTAPLTLGITTNALSGSMTQANTSTNGWLSSGDWNTFNGKESTIIAGTGLTRSVNTLNVNTSQNISTLSNLTTNGHIQTSGGTGVLSVDTTAYVPTSTTVNGHALSSNVTVTASDVGLGNVTNNAQVKKSVSSTNGDLITWNGTTGDAIQDGYAVVTSVASPGTNTNIPTEKAVRDALAGGNAPGGSSGSVQYNNSGSFGGISNTSSNGTDITLVQPIIGSSTGAQLSATSGVFTFGAIGGTNNENLTWDLESGSNKVTISSTTGLHTFNFTSPGGNSCDFEMVSTATNKTSNFNLYTNGDDWDISAGGSTVTDIPNMLGIYNLSRAGYAQTWSSSSTPVDYLNLASSNTGSNPILSAAGSDTNIGITITPKGTGKINVPTLTASTALVTDASKNIVSSGVTSTELGYVSGVTSAIQTQLDGKQPSLTPGTVTLAEMANLAANSIIGNNTGSAATPLALTISQVRSMLSINNVENTALSTWAGSTNLTTLGTIGTGTWAATTISEIHGGTNQTTYTLGDLLYASASNTLSKLAGNTTSTKEFLRMTGTGSAATAPAWDTVTKTDVGLANVENTALSTWAGSTSLITLGTITTGTWHGSIIGSLYGGTANGFTKFSGPTTSEKTFTLPDASATVLTDNASVTVAQGGTGRATSTAYAVLCGGTTSTAAQQSIASVGTSGQVLTSNGAGALPTFQTGGGTGRLLKITSFTTSGTWTKSGSTTQVLAVVVGGGGGGGSSAGGGGGGGYSEAFVTSPGSTESVTVGSGGAGGVAVGGDGGAGGASSFGSWDTGNGGAGGVVTSSAGGAGGTGSGGDVNISGQHGGATSGGSSGKAFGAGGLGVATGTGRDGALYGGGGSASVSTNTGGVGAAGIVVVYEYS